MTDLTLQEMIILVVGVAVVVSVIFSIIKGSMKIAAVALIILILFSGFTWLPEQIENILNAQPDAEEVDPGMTLTPEETLKGIGETAITIVKDNSGSWIEAAQSLWAKITGTYVPETPETPETTTTTNS